jgi:capsid protein
MKTARRTTPGHAAGGPVAAPADRPERVARAAELADLREERNRAAEANIRARALRAIRGKLEKAMSGERDGGKSWSYGGGGPRAMGSFENATRDRARSTFYTGRTGAPWVHLDRNSRLLLRRQCQALKRNNVVARTLINRHADFLVGDGAVVRPTASVGDAAKAKDWNKRAKKLFDDWANGSDPEVLGRPNIRGLSSFWLDLSAIADAMLTDGDRLVVAVDDGTGRTTFQHIIAEQLTNQGNAYLDTQTMVGGVEFAPPPANPAGTRVEGSAGSRGESAAASGSVVAFHVAGYQMFGSVLQTGTWRIPARSCYFVPNPTGYDPEQVRGEPALQAALDWFDLIDGYIEDHALAAQIQTWIGAIFTSEKPADLQAALIAATAGQPGTSGASSTASTIEYGPGFNHICKPGEGVTAFEPKFPVSGFKDFLLTLIQLTSADIGLPLAIALYLTDGLNFSNLRGIISMAARGFEKKQAVLSGLTSWVYKIKTREHIDRGLLEDRDDWDSHHVKFPPPPVVDFKMECEGYKIAVDNDFMPRGAVTEALGFGTHEEVTVVRGQEIELEEECGVYVPGVPGAVIPNGGTAPGDAAGAPAAAPADDPSGKKPPPGGA